MTFMNHLLIFNGIRRHISFLNTGIMLDANLRDFWRYVIWKLDTHLFKSTQSLRVWRMGTCELCAQIQKTYLCLNRKNDGYENSYC